jgi:hypothetical protein
MGTPRRAFGICRPAADGRQDAGAPEARHLFWDRRLPAGKPAVRRHSSPKIGAAASRFRRDPLYSGMG